MSKLPNGLQTEINKVQRDQIDFYVKRDYGAEQAAEGKETIKELRRLWRKFKDTPMVQQMVAVVEEMVTNYHSDFYRWDFNALEKDGLQTPFAWYVRDTGTHLVWLEGTHEKVHSNWSLLQALKKSSNNHSDVVGEPYTYQKYPYMPDSEEVTVESGYRLYICDPVKGTIRRVKCFSDVTFKVREEVVTV